MCPHLPPKALFPAAFRSVPHGLLLQPRAVRSQSAVRLLRFTQPRCEVPAERPDSTHHDVCARSPGDSLGTRVPRKRPRQRLQQRQRTQTSTELQLKHQPGPALIATSSQPMTSRATGDRPLFLPISQPIRESGGNSDGLRATRLQPFPALVWLEVLHLRP